MAPGRKSPSSRRSFVKGLGRVYAHTLINVSTSVAQNLGRATAELTEDVPSPA